MLEDGCNVILSDEFKKKLYREVDPSGELQVTTGIYDEEIVKNEDELVMEKKKNDPTYGLTAEQKRRFEKKRKSKPRPRDIYNVQEIIKTRERRILEKKILRQE